MKSFIGWLGKVFSGPNGEASSKRVLGAFLIVSGAVLAFNHGEYRNVLTLIGGGCALLGVGYYAERLGGGHNI